MLKTGYGNQLRWHGSFLSVQISMAKKSINKNIQFPSTKESLQTDHLHHSNSIRMSVHHTEFFYFLIDLICSLFKTICMLLSDLYFPLVNQFDFGLTIIKNIFIQLTRKPHIEVILCYRLTSEQETNEKTCVFEHGN